MTELSQRTGEATVRSDQFPGKHPPGFTLSKKTLPIETRVDGAFNRPMWGETSFGWEC